jgi:hypothetical protein
MNLCYDANKKRKHMAEPAFMLALGVRGVERIMVEYQLKLQMTTVQQAECTRWLYHLAAVWNWAVRKIELNAQDKMYFSRAEFRNLLAHHGEKLGIPSHTLQGILGTVYEAWQVFSEAGRQTAPQGSAKQIKQHSVSRSHPDASGPSCFSAGIGPDPLSQDALACGKNQVRADSEARLGLVPVLVHRGRGEED